MHRNKMMDSKSSLLLLVTLSFAMGLPISVAAGALQDLETETIFEVDCEESLSSEGMSLSMLGAEQGGAEVNGEHYSSFVAAMAASKDGSTVKLLGDAEYSDRMNVVGKRITVDLNGFTLTSDHFGFAVEKGALTLDDTSDQGSGRLKVTGTTKTDVGVVLNEMGTFTMKGGAIESVEYGIFANPKSGIKATIEGGLIKGQNGIAASGYGVDGHTEIVVTGGKIEGANSGIATNGGTSGGVVLSIFGGEVKATNEKSTGVYVPGPDGMTVIRGGRISGATGVEVRAGTLDIAGDAVIAGTGAFEVKSNPSGGTTTGCGVALAQHSTGKAISLSINGDAKISGNHAFYEWNPEKNAEDKIALISLAIKGGVFSAEEDASVYSEDFKGFVLGGTYSNALSADYIADGYEAVESNGSWTVQLKEELRVAEIEGAYYPTVAEAVAAARNGQTVKLLKGAEEDAEIRIDGNRSITLDLAGYKLDTRAHQIVVESGSCLTVKGDGELTNASTNNAVGSYVVYGMSGSNVTFDGVTVKGAYGLYTMGNALVKRASFDVTGGCAIAINGSAKVEIGDSVATAEENAHNVIVNSANNCISTQAKEGSADALCTVYGGTFTAGTNPDNPGNPWNSGPVYWASHGTLDIRGGVFKADVATAAVFQKNGTVKVSDGEFSSKDGFKIDATAKDTTEIATEISGGKFTGTRSGFYSNASNGYIDYGTRYSVKVTGGEFRGGSEGAIYVKEGAAIVAAGKRALEVTGGSFSEDPTEFVPASGYEVLESNGVFSVSKYVPPTPPSGGGSTSDKTEVEHNQDGSTTTTVTKPDGSQTITHETATGTESVVKKDEDGNVTSTEVSVSKQDAESGKVELPIEGAEPVTDIDKAPAVEVKVPASVSDKAPVQVAVPVAKGDDSEPNYGVVVFAIDEDGNETLIPKTAVDDDGNVVFEATGDVTIKVVDAAKDMPDVSESDWFAGGVVDFATARGIVNGVDTPSGKQFQGYGKTSRGMLVAMLHNLELNPEAASAESLPDVPEGAFYADAAAWALGEGILSGVDMPDGTKEFQGDAPVTREQVAVFLMRYAESLGMDVSARAEIGFPDAGEVSGFAKDAMSWAVANGLFTGNDATGELNPTDGAARAEVAAVLMRFINLMYA